MKQRPRLNRRALREQAETTIAPAADGRRNEHIRIARAFLGVTPAQLATEIGISMPAPLMNRATRPAQTFDALSSALQVVIGWYHDQLGGTSRVVRSLSDNAFGLDILIPEYLSLRARWEDRESNRILKKLKQHEAPVPTSPVERPATPARRRALLADDASDVVITVGAFLEGFGFDVASASTGDEALQILSLGEPFDLLVTDHAMPGLTGKDLAIQARQSRPSLRVLIITGYPEAAALTRLPAGVMLLAKPFRRAELQARVQTLLAAEDQFPLIPESFEGMAEAMGEDSGFA